MKDHLDFDAKQLFSSYMKLVDVPQLEAEETSDARLLGKKLGLVNGSSWVQLWSYYFGRIYLPGVKLINVGNEVIQLNFMKAHREGKECPPQSNIDLFCSYARQLCELSAVDAIMVTCSTMNRSLPFVKDAVKDFHIPVVQIDEPMMQKAVENGGKVLIIATHGPTVKSTQKLLEETTTAMGRKSALQYSGATVEDAFHLLGEGKIDEHNELIANAIREEQKKNKIDQVVLAQLSMSVFKLSYPDPLASFGVPVLTSGEEGFNRMKQILINNM